MLLLTHPWTDPAAPWTEDHLQMAVIQTLRQHPAFNRDFALAAGMEGLAVKSKRVAARAKALGLTAGEPDIRVYWRHDCGEPTWGAIELKLGTNPLTASQRLRHPILRSLGVSVEVVRARTPAEAVSLCTAIVGRWVGVSFDQRKG